MQKKEPSTIIPSRPVCMQHNGKFFLFFKKKTRTEQRVKRDGGTKMERMSQTWHKCYLLKELWSPKTAKNTKFQSWDARKKYIKPNKNLQQWQKKGKASMRILLVSK